LPPRLNRLNQGPPEATAQHMCRGECGLAGTRITGCPKGSKQQRDP
jgi:hypothetical protein